jgi:hypothetical protein
VAGLTPALGAPPICERPRLDSARGVLLGCRCRACGAGAWPARAVCHACGSAEVDQGVALARTGTLLTYTTVWVPRPGLEPPYTLGQVELEPGLEVFAHVRGLEGSPRVPLPVRLAVGGEEGPVDFWFEPWEESA